MVNPKTRESREFAYEWLRNMTSFFLLISWQTQFVHNDHSTYAWVLDYAVLKMTLLDVMLFSLLSILTLNLLNNPIQVTFIESLLYLLEVHMKLWWLLSTHAGRFLPSGLSPSVTNETLEGLSSGTSMGLTTPAWGSFEELEIYHPQKQPSENERYIWKINIQFPWSAVGHSKAHPIRSPGGSQQDRAPTPAVTLWLRHTSLVFLPPHLTFSTPLLVQINCLCPSPCYKFCFWGHSNFKKWEMGRKSGRWKVGNRSDTWDRPWKTVESQTRGWKGLNQEYKETKAWKPEGHLESEMCQSPWNTGSAEG